MAGERLEVRLDPERRQKLARIAENRGLSISYTVRELIDEAFAVVERPRWRHLVQQIVALQVEHVPDPETLSRQLAGTYDLPHLC